jgi:hypothetical protein
MAFQREGFNLIAGVFPILPIFIGLPRDGRTMGRSKWDGLLHEFPAFFLTPNSDISGIVNE